MPSRWRLSVDTGGTFTDALAVSPRGGISRAKVLSSGALRGVIVERIGPAEFRVRVSWHATADVLCGGRFNVLGTAGSGYEVVGFDPAAGLLQLATNPGGDAGPGAAFEVGTGEEAPILAARLLTGTAAGEPLPALDLRLGTTLATNALLTRSGAPTALLITEGFADLLRIGTQQRPDLFALAAARPSPLYDRVVEVPGRMAADGTEIAPLDLAALESRIDGLRDEGFECAAVALLHADRYPGHEQRLKRALLTADFAHVCCSSDEARTIRILPRAETAVVDATLTPVVAGYLARIEAAVGASGILTMTSAGGLVGSQGARPKDLLLSGPAAGVVGAVRAGRMAGSENVLSFDMGGTSTDVARCGGPYEYVFEYRVGDANLLAPALAIATVAAGGGSICRFGENGLAVGPESAGARPGPACYGAGGPLTLTDVNLLLGRLDPERFGIPVAHAPAARELAAVQADFRRRTGDTAADEAILAGFLAIANERMAEAIRGISIRRGYDPADHALVAFGGAGGQHACAVAKRLGMEMVVVPPDAGLLSAWGLSGAVIERFAERQFLCPAAEVESSLIEVLEELVGEARTQLRSEGVSADQVTISRRLAELRYSGQETPLQVEIETGRSLSETFATVYRRQYGHELTGREVELVSLRVSVTSRPEPPLPDVATPRSSSPRSERSLRAWFSGDWLEVPVYRRSRLSPGAQVEGPALILERHATTVVESGWQLRVDGTGALLLESGQAAGADDGDSKRPQAVQVELFSARFEAIARQMGEALRRTAVSTNIKERLDFSCALLDGAGELVVNAPHIPVHLGSLGLCVRGVCRALPLAEGDVAVTNHPAFGGSHLPDLTVVAPVHDGSGRLLGHVAARAHHAEIGGTRPGSMSPTATSLAEEGVVIPPTLIVAGGELCPDQVRALLREAPYPSRAPADNLADLTAAVAACFQGAGALQELATAHGADSVARFMTALKAKASRRLREALGKLADGEYTATEYLDDGTPLAVRIAVRGDRADIDFTGSGSVHPGNLNATPAIVYSVLIYVLRLLIAEEMPLNEGLLEPVTVTIPPGILNPHFPSDSSRAPAVVGGNVETSQRLVDVLLKAFGLCAASQGTMNNVLFGDDRFSYYETVCGGVGAGPGFAGASGVHSHMTNTRITDPELIELRYPVRLDRFGLRSDSGGTGRWSGGDGIVRHLTFLAPCELSLLGQRRASGPYGLEGGGDGEPGRQRLVRPDGSIEVLAGIDSRRVEPGDRLELETPGGGGYGAAPSTGEDP